MLGVQQVIVLFLLIVAGLFVKKKGIVTDHINAEVSNLVINICLPSFIIASMAFDFSVEVLVNSGMLVVLSFIIYGVSIILSRILTRVLKIQGAQRMFTNILQCFQIADLWGTRSCMRFSVRKRCFMRPYTTWPSMFLSGAMASLSCSVPTGQMRSIVLCGRL